jgi:TPR repeat protein
MFEDELARGRKGSSTSRSEFLSRYARVMQNHDLAPPGKTGGFWAELSGSGAAQGRAAEIARAVSAPPVENTPPVTGNITPPPPRPAEKPFIGFAEALIQQPHLADDEADLPVPRGIHALELDVESSWRPMHQAMPLWLRTVLFAGGSLALGAALAHLSGRALWQDSRAASLASPVRLETAPAPAEVAIDLPVAPPAPKGSKQATKTSGPKPVIPPPPPIAAIDLEPKALPGTALPVSMSPASAGSAAPESVDQRLTAKLAELRKTGGRLPAELRPAVDKAARNGSTEAMLALGRMHLHGEAGAVDERTAFTWFDRAMSAGDTAATVPLAECYLQGWGTPADPALAVDLLGKAASAGDAAAKDLLGVCYARSFGVAGDDAKAFALCNEAYAAGSVTACGNLGALYLRGQGVTQDAARAAQLFAEGARRGHSESMLLYAQSLEYGTGTPADRSQATRWYVQAARLGNAEAANWCREKGVPY